MTRYYLNEEDKDKILEMWRAWKGGTINSPQRTVQPIDQEFTTPDVYVVRIPYGGLAPLNTNTTTGTGTPDLYDDQIPYADCHVFRVLGQGTSSARFIKAGFSVRVHNLGYCHIEGGKFVKAIKDKWGVWWAQDDACPGVEEPQPDAWTGTGTYSAPPDTGTGTSTSTGGGGGETVSTTCCPAVPTTLYANFIGSTGCECLDGLTVPIVYDGISLWAVDGYSLGVVCGGSKTMRIFLSCNSSSCNSWTISVSCNSGQIPAATASSADEASCSCDPIHFEFINLRFESSPCCVGFFTVIITETPL